MHCVGTVGPFELHFQDQGEKKSLIDYARGNEALASQFAKSVNVFRIGLTVIEKSRPELDQK